LGTRARASPAFCRGGGPVVDVGCLKTGPDRTVAVGFGGGKAGRNARTHARHAAVRS
jgi:hypothetical protein